jgi:hypothetical protein
MKILDAQERFAHPSARDHDGLRANHEPCRVSLHLR